MSINITEKSVVLDLSSITSGYPAKWKKVAETFAENIPGFTLETTVSDTSSNYTAVYGYNGWHIRFYSGSSYSNSQSIGACTADGTAIGSGGGTSKALPGKCTLHMAYDESGFLVLLVHPYDSKYSDYYVSGFKAVAGTLTTAGGTTYSGYFHSYTNSRNAGGYPNILDYAVGWNVNGFIDSDDALHSVSISYSCPATTMNTAWDSCVLVSPTMESSEFVISTYSAMGEDNGFKVIYPASYSPLNWGRPVKIGAQGYVAAWGSIFYLKAEWSPTS